MAIKNFTPPHLIKKPCRKCRKPTVALRNGQIVSAPTCKICAQEEEKVFRLAQLAANRQFLKQLRRK